MRLFEGNEEDESCVSVNGQWIITWWHSSEESRASRPNASDAWMFFVAWWSNMQTFALTREKVPVTKLRFSCALKSVLNGEQVTEMCLHTESLTDLWVYRSWKKLHLLQRKVDKMTCNVKDAFTEIEWIFLLN